MEHRGGGRWGNSLGSAQDPSPLVTVAEPSKQRSRRRGSRHNFNISAAQETGQRHWRGRDSPSSCGDAYSSPCSPALAYCSSYCKPDNPRHGGGVPDPGSPSSSPPLSSWWQCLQPRQPRTKQRFPPPQCPWW